MPDHLRIELLRRLTTLSGQGGSPTVWDARVVDDRGRVASACDHGHPRAAEADRCGREQLTQLIGD